MRARKALINMSTSLIYQIIAIVCGLITPRLILSEFGSTYNGVISSATQFLAMIDMLTLGVAGATRVALYKTLANNDLYGTSRLMKALKKYMSKIGVCIIIYVAILCVIYPLVSHNDLTYGQSAWLIAVVGIGIFADFFFGVSNSTLLRAAQAGYILDIMSIIKIVLNTICVAILIKADCSIYIVKLGSALVYFITPAILSLYIKKRFSLVSHCLPDNSGLRERKNVAVHTISNIVHNNTDIVILTLFTDAKVISVYTVYYLVIGKVKSMMQIITTGMEAAFGDMWIKGEIDALRKSFSVYEYMLFTFAIIAFSCVFTLILPFVAIYTHGVNDIDYIRPGLAILITITEAMFCIRQPYLNLVYATGSFKETKWGAVAEMIINMVLSVSLVILMGMEGVIIGTLAANIFRTVQFSVFVSKNILKRSISNVIKRFIWLVATMTICVFIVIFIQKKFYFSLSWIGWFLEASIAFVASMMVAFGMSLLFYRKELEYLIETGIRAIRRKNTR